MKFNVSRLIRCPIIVAKLRLNKENLRKIEVIKFMRLIAGQQLNPDTTHQSPRLGPVHHLVFILLLCLAYSPTVSSNTIEQQRRDYLSAKKALERKQYKTFGRIANGLKDYPLYSYLRYEYLRKNLWKIKDEEMILFFENHGDLPMTESLRTSWLKLLVRRGRWQAFLDNYVPQSRDTMRCYQLQARIKTNNRNYLLEDIRSVWLSGKSLPPQCDAAFDLLYDSGLVTNELVWERISLAMANNQVGLVTFLMKKLDPEYKKLAQLWLNIHRNPYIYLNKPKIQDDAMGREIITHGLARLARQNISHAVKRFNSLQDQ